MKYIKTFEKLGEPTIGDYVICVDKDYDDLEFNNFLATSIGKVVKYQYDQYYVEYDNPPIYIEDTWGNPIRFILDEILHFSKNKEDLEIYVQANKYNI